MTGDKKIEQKVKRLNLTPAQLLNMTDEQIRERFKDSSFVMELKKKAVVVAAEKEDIFKKYRNCPKCRAPIEKYVG